MLFIDRVDEGLFISGVEGLKKIDRLHSLGIKRILNVATSDLYTKHVCDDGETLMQNLQPFEPKIIGLQDYEGVNLGAHFEEMADFIEAGRNAGGVIVHCVAGQSRSATACISYLMIKQALTLNSAWRKVYQVRGSISPNPGFWKQLRALEAKLKSQNVSLQECTDDELKAQEVSIECSSPKLSFSVGSVGTNWTLPSGLGQPAAAKASTWIVAQIVLIEGVSAEDTTEQVQFAAETAPETHGIIWTHVETLNNSTLGIRAELVPFAPPMSPPYSTTEGHLQAALHATLGRDVVKSVDVGRPLSVGAVVVVVGSKGGGRTAILDNVTGDGTWNVKYEDGEHGIVEAFHVQVVPKKTCCCLLQ
jgi:predicted protein tyrosine phosphatase